MAATSNGNKNQLRKVYLQKRNTLNENDVLSFSKKICQELIHNFNLNDLNVHLFYPIKTKKEVDTWPIHQAIGGSCRLFTSVYNDGLKEWECVSFERNTPFKEKKYHVPVPEFYKSSKWSQIDLILIPLICFDLDGNRVGYGKGIYDSICAQLKKSTIKVGLSFFDHNDVLIDKENHDIALDYCQTPSKLYQFNF